jgi:hypothetical protein
MAEPGARDEFYAGYRAAVPAALARFVRARVALLLVGAALLALGLAGAQQPFSTAVFEFGRTREFEGRIALAPHPMLLIERPGRTPAQAASSRYLLVGAGKRGADAALQGLDGRRVRLAGTLLYQADATLIELAPGSIQVLEAPALPLEGPGEDLGEQVLIGEIVDSKCYLGAMKPGQHKPHRDCAVRCISGGLPPLFVVRDAQGETRRFLLTAASGRSVNREVVDLVAEPLRIRGRVHRLGSLLVLRADPATYERLE